MLTVTTGDSPIERAASVGVVSTSPPGWTVTGAVAAIAPTLAGVRRLGVAFSGGVDSSVLLALAARVLGRGQVVAVLGVSPSLAADGAAGAHEVARPIGVRGRRGRDPRGRARRLPGERAGPLLPLQGRAVHHDRRRGARPRTGSTRSRTARTPTTRRRPDRPGSRAATEHAVLRPLAERRAGQGRRTRASPGRSDLPWPTSPPPPAWPRGSRTSRPVTPEKLRQIEQAEAALRRLGLADLRVRHHGDVARVELSRRSIWSGRPSEPLRGAGRGSRARGRVPVRHRGPGGHPVGRLHPAAGPALIMAEPAPGWPSSPISIRIGAAAARLSGGGLLRRQDPRAGRR